MSDASQQYAFSSHPVVNKQSGIRCGDIGLPFLWDPIWRRTFVTGNMIPAKIALWGDVARNHYMTRMVMKCEPALDLR